MAAEEPVPGRGRSVAAVLAAAEDEKAAGNVCFKAGDVKGAVKAYKKAFLTSHSLRCANETSAMYGGSTAPTEEEKAAVRRRGNCGARCALNAQCRRHRWLPSPWRCMGT